jgi:hypothetical protein
VKLCHKSSDNDDDWDELEDPCMNCDWWRPLEVEMSIFKVKCIKDWKYIKDLYTARVGEIVDAYVDQDRLVVGGRYISMDEFKEHFEI